MIDREVFNKLCQAPPKIERGVGTYFEKSIHSILKHCCDADRSFHEVPFLGYVCDVKKDGRIYEIQTANFAKLREKLKAFLDAGCRVEVLYPVPAARHLVKADTDSGELTYYKNARRGRESDILPELAGLCELFGCEGLSFHIISINVDELRVPTVKRGRESTAVDRRIPTELVSETAIKDKQDLLSILPPLPDCFTAAELFKALSLKGRKASRALWFLQSVGLLERDDSRRPYIYSVK